MQKTALVTGASTGIGFAFVEYLLKHNYKVFAGARKQADIEKLNKIGATAIELDVCNEEHIKHALEIVKKETSRLDVLINNAGIAIAGPAELVPLKQYREQFEVNFFGLISVTQKFLPLVREANGYVFNISSIAGRVASRFLTPYCASKFAVEAFSDGLRRELKYFGVKVVLIEPGPIDTPIWGKSISSNEKSLLESNAELFLLYETPLEKFEEEIAKSARNAIGVEKVVDCLDHALNSSSPRTRYLVGMPAKIAGAMASVLPDKVMDRLV